MPSHSMEWDAVENKLGDIVVRGHSHEHEPLISPTSGSAAPPGQYIDWESYMYGRSRAYKKVVLRCAYCRGRYPSEMYECPHCGALETE